MLGHAGFFTAPKSALKGMIDVVKAVEPETGYGGILKVSEAEADKSSPTPWFSWCSSSSAYKETLHRAPGRHLAVQPRGQHPSVLTRPEGDRGAR